MTTSLSGVTNIKYEADGLLEHTVDFIRGTAATVAMAVSGLVGTVAVAKAKKED